MQNKETETTSPPFQPPFFIASVVPFPASAPLISGQHSAGWSGAPAFPFFSVGRSRPPSKFVFSCKRNSRATVHHTGVLFRCLYVEWSRITARRGT